MSKQRKKVSLNQLKTKARPALNSSVLVGIARSARSPNQALESAKVALYELAYLETGDAKKAMKTAGKKALACHALARIKRDYGKDAFNQFVLTVSSNPPRSNQKGTDKRKKGETIMEPQIIGKENQDNEVQEEKKPLFALQHIEHRAAVNGCFARVRVIQKYTNKTEKPVEAVYVHPLPDESTVIGCIMQIGQRKIVAELNEREQARKEYDEAVSQGHHGALMEQERPNIFTMNVGGIEPGETIEVQIDYVQQIPWQAGGGRFTIPLVVAPRFIPGTPTGVSGGGWSPDTDQVPDASKITPVVDPQGVSYTASINIIFSPGFRCKLECPSHIGLIEEKTVSKDETVQLNTGEIKADRDFTLSYRSVSNRPQVSSYHWQTPEESFCLVSIVPPSKVQEKDDSRDVIFLLDRSYSMKGPAIAGLRILCRKMLTKHSNDRPQDRIGIIAFNGYTKVIAPLGEISEQTFESISQIHAKGGTDLGPALSFTHQQFANNGREKVIVVITDGETESRVHYEGLNARIVTAGLSSAINDTNLKDIARKTGGSFHAFYPGEDFDRAANTVLAAVSGPVLEDISIDNQGQLVGVKSAFADRPAVLAMRFDKELPAEIKVSGKLLDGQVMSWDIKPGQGKECDYLAQIWAREYLREHTGKEQQVPISLKYGVICEHTAFVAISEKEVPGQKPERQEQPAERPHGWTMEADWGGTAKSVVSSSGFMSRRSGSQRLIGARASSGAVGFMPESMKSSSLGGLDDDLMGCHLDATDDCFGGADFEDCYDEIEEIGGVLVGCDACEVEEVEVDSVSVTPLSSNMDTFDQNESIHNLVEALIQAESGLQEMAEDFVKKAKLTVTAIANWTALEKAKAYYFALRLSSLDRKLFDSKVIEALAQKPAKSDALAWAWFNLAQKENGIPFESDYPITGDDSQYILWKFAKGAKPTQNPWSLVP